MSRTQTITSIAPAQSISIYFPAFIPSIFHLSCRLVAQVTSGINIAETSAQRRVGGSLAPDLAINTGACFQYFPREIRKWSGDLLAAGRCGQEPTK